MKHEVIPFLLGLAAGVFSMGWIAQFMIHLGVVCP
jgi:uncharacterized membrane protein YGL010W